MEDSPGRASLQQEQSYEPDKSGFGFRVWRVQPGREEYCPSSLTPQMAPFLTWRGGASPSTLLEATKEAHRVAPPAFMRWGDWGSPKFIPHFHENNTSVVHLGILINKLLLCFSAGPHIGWANAALNPHLLHSPNFNRLQVPQGSIHSSAHTASLLETLSVPMVPWFTCGSSVGGRHTCKPGGRAGPGRRPR